MDQINLVFILGLPTRTALEKDTIHNKELELASSRKN